MESLKKVIFFTKECYYTSKQDKMHYWVEIDESQTARFYKKGLISPSFYTEFICNTEDENHLRNYLQILLKSRVMIESN